MNSLHFGNPSAICLVPWLLICFSELFALGGNVDSKTPDSAFVTMFVMELDESVSTCLLCRALFLAWDLRYGSTLFVVIVFVIVFAVIAIWHCWLVATRVAGRGELGIATNRHVFFVSCCSCCCICCHQVTLAVVAIVK